MAQVNTFKTYFQTHSGNEDANTNVLTFANDSTVDAASSAKFCSKNLQAVLTDIDALVIAKFPISNYLCLYHSITKLGGNRARPANKIVRLLGSGPDTIAITFQEDSLKQTVEIDCLMNATLRHIFDKSNNTAAVIAPTRPLKLHNAAFQFLEPLFSPHLTEIIEKDPDKLLVELNTII